VHRAAARGSTKHCEKLRELQRLNGEKEEELQKILTPAQWTTYLDEKGDLRKKLDAKLAARQS